MSNITLRDIVVWIAILVYLNMILSYFLALFTTAPYFKKIIADKGYEDVKPTFLSVFFARPLAFAIAIVMELCSSKPWPNDMYGDLSLFGEHARGWDIYLAFSMMWGFVVSLVLTLIIKTFDYFVAG